MIYLKYKGKTIECNPEKFIHGLPRNGDCVFVNGVEGFVNGVLHTDSGEDYLVVDVIINIEPKEIYSEKS